MSVTVEQGSRTTENESDGGGFILDPCDIPEIDTTEPPEPDSVGKTVSGQREHSLREPLPEFDTLTDIRWFCHRSDDPTVDGVLGQLGLDEDEWRGVIEGIVAGEEVLGHNPIQTEEVSDDLRAALLWEYVRSIQNVCPNPLLMPLAEWEGRDVPPKLEKAPAIAERVCDVGSDEALSLLHSPAEAVEAVRNGAKGFGIYVGKESHRNTDGVVCADHDDTELFPLSTLPDTLTVRSGSGEFHEWFVTHDRLANTNGDWGELRVTDEYCVLPGAVHPSGGVYHVSGMQEPTTLRESDLPKFIHSPGDDSEADTGSNGSTPSDIDVDIDHSKQPSDDYSNIFDISLDEHREMDYKLDALLNDDPHTDDYPAFIDEECGENSDGEPDTSTSGIDARIVSKLKYYYYTDQQITELLKKYHDYSEVRRPYYVELTISKCASHDDRFYPGDYFDPNECPQYLALLPDIDVHNGSGDIDGGGDGLTIDQIRDRLSGVLEPALENEEWVLIDCLPGIGKSYGVITATAGTETDTPLTILTSRHDLYDQYERWCSTYDLESYVLPSFHDHCETAGGDYGTEWRERVRSVYDETNLTAREIHDHAESYFGEQLPCYGDCSWRERRDFRPGDYDVLIGNYVHAYNSNLTEGRTVVVDESCVDSFTEVYERDEVVPAFNQYVAGNDRIPFDTYTDLEYRNDPEYAEEIEAAKDWFEDEQGITRDSSVVLDSDGVDSGAHVDAPLIVYSLLVGEDLGNDWETACLDPNDDNDGTRRFAARDRHTEELFIRRPPDFFDTDGLLCLDGTPAPSLWESSVGGELEVVQLLSDEERMNYLRDEYGLQIIQTSDTTKPYSARHREYLTPRKDATLLNGITDEVGYEPPLITPNQCLKEYQENGILPTEGNDDPNSRETMNFSEIKSSNSFKDESVGIVLGSTHYGDDAIKKESALQGEIVDRVDNTKGNGLEYTTELGDETLENQRESPVFQSAMRYGRQEEINPTVFVHSSALPEWVPVEKDGSVTKVNESLRQILYALAAIDAEEKFNTQDGFTTKNVVNRADASRRVVSKHLNRLEEYGYLDKSRPKNATRWQINALPFTPSE